MNIGVIGTGYVGLVTGACLADKGNKVVCIDIDKQKIENLKNGILPIYEPGLDEVVSRAVKQGDLMFSSDIQDAARESEVIFLAVGTPPKQNGSADLSYVLQAAEDIAKALSKYAVIVTKSTVPVGTSKRIKKRIASHYSGEFDVASNPEFLREGAAVKDFLNPDRIVVGTESDRARTLIQSLYHNFLCPKVFTSIESSEMTKYASNAFLATKISFINEIANVCENVGADIEDVAKGMGLDPRIGKYFLRAGLGYGGSCFPKDVRALHQTAGLHGYPFQLLRSVIEVNNYQRWIFFQKIKRALGPLSGKNIAVWGLSFKPETDDTRESIAIELIERFLEEGAIIKAYDPQAMPHVRQHHPEITLTDSALSATEGADALILVTEWAEFINADFEQVSSNMTGKYIFDGRNVLNKRALDRFDFIYQGIGRTL